MTNPPPPSNPALTDALARLESAERTTAELRADLLKRHAPEEVEAALAWLSAKRFLSDERAAESLVRPRSRGRRAEGDARLRQRLEARGASEETIDQAIADAPDEAQRMHEALSAKFRPEVPEHAKAGRFLLLRGFDEEAVGGVLERFFGETGET